MLEVLRFFWMSDHAKGSRKCASERAAEMG